VTSYTARDVSEVVTMTVQSLGLELISTLKTGELPPPSELLHPNSLLRAPTEMRGQFLPDEHAVLAGLLQEREGLGISNALTPRMLYTFFLAGFWYEKNRNFGPFLLPGFDPTYRFEMPDLQLDEEVFEAQRNAFNSKSLPPMLLRGSNADTLLAPWVLGRRVCAYFTEASLFATIDIDTFTQEGND
jgi:hypothetical protein